MTPVKVLIVCFECETLKFNLEWDVWPTLYKIVRLRELPAALILPLSRIFSPFICSSGKI
tara:strand:+ start:1525 stop:1704 length:180 start_codon:yes stop_codon:yes gene_type:complete